MSRVCCTVIVALGALGALGALLAASCAPAVPDAPGETGASVSGANQAVALEVHEFPARVVYGDPFEFVLVRACDTPLELEPFDEAQLAPLLVRTLSVESERAGERVVETRRLHARALALGDAPLPALVARARFGGREESARLDWPPLSVETSLAADDDGRAELPLELLGPERRVRPLVVALAVVTILAAGAAIIVVRRRRPVEDGTLLAAPTARESDNGAFDVWLADLRSAARSDDRTLYTTLVAVLRRAAGVRCARDLSSATARELVRLVDDARIAGPCARSEQVCFARLPIEADARARDLEAAERFVEDVRERRHEVAVARQEGAR